MREVEFVVCTTLCGGGKQVVDFRIGDNDLVVDFAFAQTRHENFAADIFAKTRKRNAVFFQRQPQLRDDHLVILRDTLDGAIQFRVVDAHAVLFGKLRHRAI